VQENLPGTIHDQQMHRAVFPPARVHFASRCLTRHAILFVHDIEKLFKILCHASFLPFIRRLARANFTLSAGFIRTKLGFLPL
jgi:hypothetical protein